MDTNKISDGYHTFGELYQHRTLIYISLCRAIEYLNAIREEIPVWKTTTHSDGSSYEGWFLLGIYKEKGKQITYHLENSYWDMCNFAETLDKAPEWDGHNSNDVLNRLKLL